MAFGAMSEGIRRATGVGGGNNRNNESSASSSSSSSSSLMMSAGNMNRLVARLSRMRGAALKLGQMISFQGMYLCFCSYIREGKKGICDSIFAN